MLTKPRISKDELKAYIEPKLLRRFKVKCVTLHITYSDGMERLIKLLFNQDKATQSEILTGEVKRGSKYTSNPIRK